MGASLSDEHQSACAACEARLATCSERLRRARLELDRQRRWLESRAARLSPVIEQIDRALSEMTASGASPSRRRRRASRSGGKQPALASVRATMRGDGFWEIRLDSWPPFRLPPLVGRLFVLLAEDAGHEAGDGLVGFKSNARLLAGLPGMNARALAQAVHVLRRALGGAILHGGALIQTRRGVGRRVVVRRQAPRGRHDPV